MQDSLLVRRREPSAEPARNFEGLVLGLAFGLLTVAGMFGLYGLWLKHTSLFAATPALVMPLLNRKTQIQPPSKT